MDQASTLDPPERQAETLCLTPPRVLRVRPSLPPGSLPESPLGEGQAGPTRTLMNRKRSPDTQSSAGPRGQHPQGRHGPGTETPAHRVCWVQRPGRGELT